MNVDSFSVNGITYRAQKRKCGKVGCNGCPHGPYWSAIYWSDGKPKTEYFGRELPAEILALRPTAPAPVAPVPMLARTAARILGVSLSHPFDRVQPIYLRMTKEVRGRTDEARARKDRIEESWRVLCDYHGWM